MSDEIKQTFGFDASQALDSLNQLDAGFAKLEQNLQGSLRTFTAFNAGAGKTVSALIQIEQKANAAANALGRLNSIKNPPSVSGGGLPGVPGAGGGQQQLLSGAAAAAAMNQLLGQTASSAANAGAAVNQLGNQASTALNGARRAGSGFALSLETITRVIGTQLIVRALNSIRSAVEGSFQGFIDFNRKIAEVQTIAGEPIEKLSKDVRGLSDAFNAPILDVATAKYQALSNGFTTAADSTAVLTAALKFSKVGIADVTSSVDLISTALNAYGQSADQAETLSAKLFRTIELGRVVGSQLAASFGRVAPIASEVGASQEEILAAFSSITIGGVKASEAATQIRSSLTALLKPSDAMKDAFHELGVETGEEAVRAFGYRGALEALIGTTDGTTSAIAKLFPNVRAINGVLREVGSGAQIFEEHLKKIQEASRELINQKFQIRIESDAEKVSSDLNKVKNFFTVDLGQSLVKGVAGISDFVGGVDNAIQAMDALAPVIGAAVFALVSYNTVTLTATGVSRLLAISFKEGASAATLMGGAVSTLVAGLAAFELGKFIGQQITDTLNADFEHLKDITNQELEFEKNHIEAKANLDKIASDKKFQLLNQEILEVKKAYTEQTDAAKEDNQKLLEDDKTTIEAIVSQHEKLAEELKHSAEQANNDITSSHQRSTDIQAKLDDQRFNFQTSRSDSIRKSLQDQQRAQELASQAAASLAKAHSKSEQDAALAVFQRAQSYAGLAASSAANTKNTTLQAQAEQTVESVLQKQLDAEKQLQSLKAQDAAKAEAAAKAEQQRADDLKALGKTFLDNANLFGKNGDLLPADKLNQNLATAQEALAKFKEKAFGPGSKFDVRDLIDVSKLQDRLNEAVSAEKINTLKASDSALEELHKQIQGSLDQRAKLVRIAPNPEALKGLPFDQQIIAAQQQSKDLQQNSDAARQSTAAREAAENEIAKSQQIAEASFHRQVGATEEWITLLKAGVSILTNGVADTKKPIDALSALRSDIQSTLKSPSIDSGALQQLGDRLETIKRNAPSSGLLNFNISSAQEEYQQLLKIYEIQQRLDKSPSASANAGVLEDATQALDKAQREADASQTSATANEQASAALQSASSSSETLRSALDGSIEATAQIAANMANAARSAADAATKSAQIQAGGGAQAAAMGGLIRHFSTGGFASRGTDTVPAMLSPGEMVINAHATSRFLPQLQSINAGIQPSFNTTNNRGGDTINIGDINVHADPNPKTTAREIVDLIRRQQRLGTVNRFK